MKASTSFYYVIKVRFYLFFTDLNSSIRILQISTVSSKSDLASGGLILTFRLQFRFFFCPTQVFYESFKQCRKIQSYFQHLCYIGKILFNSNLLKPFFTKNWNLSKKNKDEIWEWNFAWVTKDSNYKRRIKKNGFVSLWDVRNALISIVIKYPRYYWE